MNLRNRLFAFIIGDCHVGFHSERQRFPHLTMRHGKDQYEYLRWKSKQLADIGCLENVYYLQEVINRRDGKSFKAYDTRFKGNNLLLDIWRIAYPHRCKTYNEKWINKDTIDDYALAIWWMDDGSLHYSVKYSASMTGVLCTHCTMEEIHIVKDVIDNALNLNAENQTKLRRRRKDYALYFPPLAYLNLIELIAKYIHPTMLYKCSVLLGEDKRPIIPNSAEQLLSQIKDIKLKMYSDTLSN